ncbi:Transcriptional regulatory protein LiaR [Paenibacillus konkukensis]|uniref:Transcriptional regulatory protein LiaR n=2 Tax=Paenibacillus konkukensis TaxID=2020716 RepID=A0ABY4RXE2_9BACL|nr:Transcriptional regulatory protein LiaR [Paenibacillus konkukensis]
MRQRANSIEVLLVDSDPSWQQRIVTLIDAEQDMKVSWTVSTEEMAIRAGLQLDVDVMILDVSLSEGLEVVVEILRKKTLPIIVLTSLNDREVIIDAILSGATNYITKENYIDILKAIREAYYDKPSLHADAVKVLRNEIELIKRKELHCMLTPAERDILKLIGWGYSQPIIRDLLGITSNTMKSHVRNINRKFNARTIREAARKAERRGLYDRQYAT